MPSKLNENVKIASKMVQLLNNPRFSVAANECSSAVPTIHGMNDAFSTGSQNHQPPEVAEGMNNGVNDQAICKELTYGS